MQRLKKENEGWEVTSPKAEISLFFRILLVQPLTCGRQAPNLNTVVWSCTHYLLSSETILGQLRLRKVSVILSSLSCTCLWRPHTHTQNSMHSTLEWTVSS